MQTGSSRYSQEPWESSDGPLGYTANDVATLPLSVFSLSGSPGRRSVAPPRSLAALPESKYAAKSDLLEEPCDHR